MAKTKETYQIMALKSAAGEYMLSKGGTYNVPTDIPADVAEDYLKGGLATKIKSKSNTDSRTASIRETR